MLHTFNIRLSIWEIRWKNISEKFALDSLDQTFRVRFKFTNPDAVTNRFLLLLQKVKAKCTLKSH